MKIGIGEIGGSCTTKPGFASIHLDFARPVGWCEGYGNRVKQGGKTLGYVLFGDLDGCDEAECVERLDKARRRMGGFGDCFLIRTNKGFHAVVPEVHDDADALLFSFLLPLYQPIIKVMVL